MTRDLAGFRQIKTRTAISLAAHAKFAGQTRFHDPPVCCYVWLPTAFMFQPSRLSSRFLSLPVPLVAVIAMIVASLFFSGLSAFVRSLGETLHPFEVTFFRNLAGLAFMLPWLARHGLGSLRTKRIWLYGWRSGLGLASMLLSFTSLTLLPFAQAIALSFTTPLFATLGAALILGEKVRVRRWAATIIGFTGVVVMLHPNADYSFPAGLPLAGPGLGVLLAIGGALISAVVTLIVKDLSRTEPSDAIVTYMVLLLTPMSLIPALPVWQWPPLAAWPSIIAMGACGSLGHMCYVRAFAMTDASAVMPYDYTRLIFAAAIGYFAFAEMPDLWTWVGGAIIAGAAIYIAHREALARRTAAQIGDDIPGSI
jgi:drug/metabolite transporter (DMT)-like permease